MNYLEAFVLLQFLDFATTVVGFRLGAGEANPLAMWAMHATGTIAGLLAMKGLAAAWGALCLIRKKPMAIKIVNCMFAGLLVWNVWMIAGAAL